MEASSGIPSVKELKALDQHHKHLSTVQVLLADLKACSRSRNLERGKQVHANAVECGHETSMYVASSLINMYAKCGSMADAHTVFDRMKSPNVVCWNALLLGYAENGHGLTALDLFTRMTTQGPAPSSVTFIAAFKACACLALTEGFADRVNAIHKLAFQKGSHTDIYVQCTMIDMYARCGNMVAARQVFERMKRANVVSWNTLIWGYADNGEGLTALNLFIRMQLEGPIPTSRTFVAALKACIAMAAAKEESRGCREWGKAIHSLAGECYGANMYVQSSLIDLYSKQGQTADARRVFDSMKQRDVVSWTVLIMGYADTGQGVSALDLFTRMRSEGPPPDSVAFAGALKACGLLGALEIGRRIHSDIDREAKLNVILVNCLVDFYAKCGSLVEAQSVFDSHAETRDVITWSALLAGFSSCGDKESVFGLFQRMQDAGFRPNSVTLLCILTCCSHAGLVEKGKECFDSMPTKYGLAPGLEHYNCMLDIFGRANRLDDALTLLDSMPCTPNDVTWMTILDACRKWRNVEIGRVAFQALVTLNDTNAAAYVLMGQIYGSRGMLREQEMVMGMRKKSKAWERQGGSCWTNEGGEVHTFVMNDSRHPQIGEIREKWRSIVFTMRRQHGYVPRDFDPEEGASMCDHSERLALACALINTKAGMTIRIVKNLRACSDCHTVFVLVSKMEHRTIICRDGSRIHVFNDGKCSCGGFW